MSTLRVNNLDYNGSPSLVSIAEGVIKMWASVSQIGTQSIFDSFNVTSITDTGVGVTQYNLNSFMKATNYSVMTSGVAMSSYVNNVRDCPSGFRFVDKATIRNIENGTGVDTQAADLWILGDLA